MAVPYIDLDRMVREVRALLRDEGLRARVGERGRATVERHFARDGACSRIVSIVETLASSVPAVGVAVGGSTPAPAERAADSLN